MAGGSKYGYLLGDADVRRWFSNVARGSRVTADVYLRRLGAFCERLNIAPKQLIALSENDLYDIFSWRANTLIQRARNARMAASTSLKSPSLTIKTKICDIYRSIQAVPHLLPFDPWLSLIISLKNN